MLLSLKTDNMGQFCILIKMQNWQLNIICKEVIAVVVDWLSNGRTSYLGEHQSGESQERQQKLQKSHKQGRSRCCSCDDKTGSDPEVNTNLFSTEIKKPPGYFNSNTLKVNNVCGKISCWTSYMDLKDFLVNAKVWYFSKSTTFSGLVLRNQVPSGI